MTEYPMLDDKLATLRNAIDGGVKADSMQSMKLMELVDAIGEQFKREVADASAPTEMSPEFTDSARAALVWVLYHHQGGSSPVGQPIRFALGMGAHDPLKPAQIGEALKLAQKCHFPAARELATTPSAPAVDAGARDEREAHGILCAALRGLANHVRACSPYKLLRGDMEFVDQAIAALSEKGETTAGEPKLAVWYGPMPESNGKTNWTAILHKGDIASGMTIDRSEYPDCVRYEADRVRWLIGELDEEPFILDYDADKHSGYAAPPAASGQKWTKAAILEIASRHVFIPKDGTDGVTEGELLNFARALLRASSATASDKEGA